MNVLRKTLRTLRQLPMVAYRALRWRTAHWLPRHLLHHRSFCLERMPSGSAVDVMVVLADHFEPIRTIKEPGDEQAGVAAEAVSRWCQEYERRFSRFRDADGRCPQYSWVYAV